MTSAPPPDRESGEEASVPGRGVLAGSGQLAVAMMVLNLGTYGFTMVTARIIGPAAYGAFFALMNLMLIVGVVSLGLQATAARRVAAAPESVSAVETAMLRVSRIAAACVAGALLVSSPYVDRLLVLDNVAMAVIAALAAIPLTLLGTHAGILQGERRWRELSIFYILSGVPRFVIGLSLILWQPTELMAFLGVALGYVVPWLYGTHALRRSNHRQPQTEDGSGSALRETVVNSQALLAYFALTNADMLLARAVLDGHGSGLYAAGLIVARAVLFLPQFVVIIAFPSLSAEESRGAALLRSLALVAALGVTATVATALLPGLALVFAGGGAYDEVRTQLWLFAWLGTVMAMLHLMVYSVLARRGTVSVLLVWAAVAVMVAAGLATDSLAGLLGVVISVQTALLLVLLLLSYLRISRLSGAAPAQ